MLEPSTASNASVNYPTPPLYIHPAERIISSGYLAIVGIIGIIFNILNVITICSNKKLRTPCFLLLAGHAFFSLFSACIFSYDGIRQWRIMFDVSPEITRLFCFIPQCFKYFGMTSSAVLTCVIGADRLLSLVMPIFYKNRRFSSPRTLAIPSLIFSSCVGMIFVIASSATQPGPILQLIACPNAAAGCAPIFLLAYLYNIMLWDGASVFIYLAIILVVKVKKYHNNTAGTTDPTLKTQLQLLPLINSIMLAHTLFLVAPEFFLSTFSLVDNGRYQPRIILYTGMLVTTSLGTDFLVLVSKSKEFRSTLMRIIKRMTKCGAVAVTPTPIASNIIVVAKKWCEIKEIPN